MRGRTNEPSDLGSCEARGVNPLLATAAILTEREEQILSRLAKGFSNKEIADLLSVSLETVRTHLRHIYEKLHVHSRTEAVVKYLDR